jgi:aspartate carbamoyltransferase catalytic subunit
MMGIGVISTNAAGIFSSAAKGETIEDNARTLDQFGYKAVVIRHGEKGNLARAAMASQTPIINAGDGPGEHPTQALLDADTIYREFGSLEGKHIVFGGDLKYGRTVHSLVTLMSQFKDTRMTFASVPELKIPDELKDLLDISNIPYEETHDVYDALRDASTDVVYWTRTQKERMSESKTRNLKRHVKSAGSRIVQQTVKIAQRYGWVPQPEEPQAGFVLNPDTIKNLPKKARIMHPLPRVDEIDAAIDQDPRSIYFSQVKNGLYCRAALLDIIIENTPRS